MRQIFWIILIGCAVIFGAIWYTNRSKTHALNTGEVHVRESQGDAAKTATDPTSTGSQSADQATAAAQAPSDAAAPASSQQATQDAPVAPPVSDSIARNPPNGMLFAGTGKYQLYRQGDITWRLDTDSGAACILFATDEEWKKPRVFHSGCAGR